MSTMKIVKEVSGEYVDMTLADYRDMKVSGVHGGATWLYQPGIFNVSYIVPVMVPVEILRALEAGNTVRAQRKAWL